jgi:hypothetical protein
MTRYVVLRQSDPVVDGSHATSGANAAGPRVTCWVEVVTDEFRDPEVAKKQAAEQIGPGVYVAVPERSWNPEKLAARQMTVWEIEPVAAAASKG